MKAGIFDRSLLISVADYMPDENGNQIDLNGPNNDTKDVLMALMLSSQHKPKGKFRRFLRRLFKARKSNDSREHVRITDSAATKKNMVKELEVFASSIKDDELGLFHYSGHGTQAIDRTGLEYDGLAECFCPYDTMAGELLSDDEVRDIFNKNLTSTGKIIMILDCCHSGGQARSLEKTRGVQVDFKITRNFSIDDRLHPNVLVWAACGEGEVAWERVYLGSPRGAFTQAVLPFIKQMTQGVKIDLAEAHKQVLIKLNDPDVPNNKGSQTPHMESLRPVGKFWH